MQHRGILIALVALLLTPGGTAAGQAPRRAEPMTAQFLEQHVRHELESEGVVLSNHNLDLRIEQLADRWLVSLVELTTGHVTASTKIDQLPADRDAAVAVMTDVVANLEAQVLDRGPEPEHVPPQAAPPPPVAPLPPDPAPAENQPKRMELQIVERSFKQRSLRFAALYEFNDLHGVLDVRRRWLVLRGDPGQALEPVEFYRALGRDDLARAYHRRQATMVGSYVVGSIALAISSMLALIAIEGDDLCNSLSPVIDRDTCKTVQQDPLLPLLISAGTAVAGIAIGTHYYFHPHPVDENDARALADAYNQRLRRELDLPVAIRRPLLRDLTLTPFVVGRDSGLALRARF
jgi:hypothetical protein